MAARYNTGKVIEVILDGDFGRLSMTVSAEEDPPARMLHLCYLKRHTIVVRPYGVWDNLREGGAKA